MMDRTLDRLRAEVIHAAYLVAFGPEQVEQASHTRYDTALAHLTPKQLRDFRDSLRELKLSETRPVNRYWDRPRRDEAGERKAEAMIREDIRKRDGIVLGRDPLGRRVEMGEEAEGEDV